MEVIVIHKVITRVIWWVDIDHLDLAHIGVLEQFQYFKVVTLDIEVLRGVPIYALFGARAQRLTTRCCSLALGSPFANPSKVVLLRLVSFHILTKQFTQLTPIDYSTHLASYGILRLSKARWEQLIECIEIAHCSVCGFFV